MHCGDGRKGIKKTMDGEKFFRISNSKAARTLVEQGAYSKKELNTLVLNFMQDQTKTVSDAKKFLHGIWTNYRRKQTRKSRRANKKK